MSCTETIILLVRRLLFFFICNNTINCNNQPSSNYILPPNDNSLKPPDSAIAIDLSKSIKYPAILLKQDPDLVLPFQQKLDILVVDDVFINRKILANILQKQGHNVIEANNGQDAVDVTFCCYQQHKPLDLIFMDIDMPIMDGLTATITIRKDIKFKHVIIIAYTSREYLEQDCYNYFDEYVQKPANPSAIQALLFKFTHTSSSPIPTVIGEAISSPLTSCSQQSSRDNLRGPNKNLILV